MTLISFVGGIRERPKVSFHNCTSEERTRDTIDLTVVCTGFSSSLELSNLSRLWRTLLKPGRKHPFYQESHLKGRSGNEDSMGAWCPRRQGRVCLLPFVGRFAFLHVPEWFCKFQLCSPFCRCEEGRYSVLGGRTGWSKGSWGSGRAGCLYRRPGLAQAAKASCLLPTVTPQPV